MHGLFGHIEKFNVFQAIANNYSYNFFHSRSSINLIDASRRKIKQLVPNKFSNSILVLPLASQEERTIEVTVAAGK
jgi:hypothetical protein